MAKDAVLDRAVDLARQAAREVAQTPDDVGEHLGATWEAERLVTHRFACSTRGYSGWQWTVTVARVPRGRSATVCEAVLLPGDGALLARPWVPWAERLRPGDLGAGDVLPFRPDDPRLEPGWKPSGDPDADDAALVPVEELALARERVLAPLGRNETAARWYRGSHGPMTAGALAATAACATCGFLLPIRGALGQVFGVCANEWSPDDGTVVSADHGCGAHSQTDADPEPSQWPAPDPIIDDGRVEMVRIDRDGGEDAPGAGPDDAGQPDDAGDGSDQADEAAEAPVVADDEPGEAGDAVADDEPGEAVEAGGAGAPDAEDDEPGLGEPDPGQVEASGPAPQ
ncbi:MAG: DUF3027 domain-containing protein [Micrococcales bacterium]|nr:DUF3027 domain-containing protein [Micrococcales bacterium]